MPRLKSSTILVVLANFSVESNGWTDFKYFSMVSSSLGSGKCGKLSGLDGVMAWADDNARFGDNVIIVSCWMESFRVGFTCIMLAFASIFIGIDFPIAVEA